MAASQSCPISVIGNLKFTFPVFRVNQDLLRRWWQMHGATVGVILPAMPKAYEFPCGATIIIEMDLGW